MSFEVKGIDKLIKKFEQIGNIPDQAKEKYVLEAAEVVATQMRSDAPKADKYSKNSKRHLKPVATRIGNEYLFIDIGINKSNFEQTRGLWFQNWEGEHSSGEYLLWMEKSFKKSSPKAKKIIKDGLSKELGL